MTSEMPTGNAGRVDGCEYTMSCEKWDSTTSTWTALTVPSSEQYCVDTDSTTDLNNNRCSDYTADNGGNTFMFDCTGSTNGAGGFDAANQCCFCGGGTISTTPTSTLKTTEVPFETCDTTDGIILYLNQYYKSASYDDYRPTVTETYRVVFTSTYSMVTDGSNQVIDEFKVVYTDPCSTLTLALNTGVEDFTYLVQSSATKMTKTPVFDNSDTSSVCAVSKTWYGKEVGTDEDAW